MYPNLKLQLWRAGIRQNRLAKVLGMHESMLSKMINGFREPGPEIRTKIAALLNANEIWLFETTPDNKALYHAGKSTNEPLHS